MLAQNSDSSTGKGLEGSSELVGFCDARERQGGRKRSALDSRVRRVLVRSIIGSFRLTDARSLLDIRPSQHYLLLDVVEEQEDHRLVQTDAEVLGSERETSFEVEGEELITPGEESTLVRVGVEEFEAVESGVELMGKEKGTVVRIGGRDATRRKETGRTNSWR